MSRLVCTKDVTSPMRSAPSNIVVSFARMSLSLFDACNVICRYLVPREINRCLLVVTCRLRCYGGGMYHHYEIGGAFAFIPNVVRLWRDRPVEQFFGIIIEKIK